MVRKGILTRILGILWADVVVAGIQDILVHECRTGGNLSEKGDLDGLANLDTLTFLHKYLPSVLAAVFAVERWHTVLFGVMALFEWLEGGHEVMSARDAVCHDTLSDTCCHGALDDGGDRVHRTHNLGLELRGYVELDLLEEVLGCAESTDNKHVLSIR
jgi:hypothetical protein